MCTVPNTVQSHGIQAVELRVEEHFQETEMIADRIAAMILQEKERYTCEDYLLQHGLGNDDSKQVPLQDRDDSHVEVDEHCRKQICQWFFQVVDHFNMRREVVSISLSYLDRFLSCLVYGNGNGKRKVLRNRKIFKLVATASMFLAVKVHESACLRTLTAVLPELSGGEFSMNQIADMELIILQTLGWLVNPPTVTCLVGHFLALISHTASNVTFQGVANLAQFLSELQHFDYFFVTKNPSKTAFAAVLNAVECSCNEDLPFSSRTVLLAVLKRIDPDLRHDSVEMIHIRSRLWNLYRQNGSCPCCDDDGDELNHATRCSPVCVATFAPK